MKKFLLVFGLLAAGIAQAQPPVIVMPTGQAGAAINGQASTVAEASHNLKGSAGNFYSAYAVNQTATAGFLLVFDAVAAPAPGAVTPKECVPLPVSGIASINYNFGPPESFQTGIVIAVSSGANCFTYTTGTITAYFHWSVE